MTLSRSFVLACTATITLVASQARAAVLLDGQTVGYQYLFPTSSSVYYQPADFVVGPGVELGSLYQASSDVGQLDVSDTNLLVKFYASGTSFTAGAFNGFRLYDSTNSIAPFTSVTVNPATNMPGFTGLNVTFDADNIYVNWQGLSIEPNYVVSIDVNTTGAVPAPSTLVTWTGVMAVVAVVGIVRRRQATVFV